jgi:hypothetical protein
MSRMNKKAAEFGFIGGLICVSINVFAYVMGIEFMTSWTYGFSLLAVYLGLDIFFSLRLKRVPLEEVSYGQAFGAIMIYLLTAGLISTLYRAILYNLIDPELALKEYDARIQSMITFMEGMGAPQEQIDKALEDAKFSPSHYTAGGLFVGFLFTTVWYSIFAAIMAIFVRKQKPLFNSSLDTPVQ